MAGACSAQEAADLAKEIMPAHCIRRSWLRCGRLRIGGYRPSLISTVTYLGAGRTAIGVTEIRVWDSGSWFSLVGEGNW